MTKSSDSQPCYKKPCVEDMEYDYWAEWSQCSLTCGGEGVRNRKRVCATSAFRYHDEYPLAKPCYDNPGTEWEPCYSPVCLEPISNFHNGDYNIRDPDRQFLTTTTTSTSTTSTTSTSTSTTSTSTVSSTTTSVVTPEPTEISRSATIIRVSVLYFFVPVLAFLVLIAFITCCFGKLTPSGVRVPNWRLFLFFRFFLKIIHSENFFRNTTKKTCT